MSDILNKLRLLTPEYKDVPDDELVSILHQEYTPNVPIQKVYDNLGVTNPEADGNFVRGLKEQVPVLKQAGYGILGGAGALGEYAAGEGGIATGIRKAGEKGFLEKQAELQETAKPSDDWDTVHAEAKAGDFSGMGDFIAHAAGAGLGQVGFAVATGGVGGMAGKVIAKEAFTGMMERATAAQAEKLLATNAAEIVAGKTAQALTQESATTIASDIVANKVRDYASTGAVMAMGTGQEAGEVGGTLTTENTGKVLTGEQLSKGLAYSLAAGGLEGLSDVLGIKAITGKLPVGKAIGEATGLTGRVARGALAGAEAAPIEGATELGQTFLERAGEGKEVFTPEGWKEARTAAAQGAFGGHFVGTLGGLATHPKIAEATNVTDAIAGANAELELTTNELNVLPITPTASVSPTPSTGILSTPIAQQDFLASHVTPEGKYVREIDKNQFVDENFNPVKIKNRNELTEVNVRSAKPFPIESEPMTFGKGIPLEQHLASLKQQEIKAPETKIPQANITEPSKIEEAKIEPSVSKPITEGQIRKPNEREKSIAPGADFSVDLGDHSYTFIPHLNEVHVTPKGIGDYETSDQEGIVRSSSKGDTRRNVWNDETPDAWPKTIPDKIKNALIKYSDATNKEEEIVARKNVLSTIDSIANKKPVAQEANNIPTTPIIKNAPEAVIFSTKRQGEVGIKLGAGESVITSSGRETSPFPKFTTKEDNTKPVHIKAVDKWLMQNAIDEANSRGDEFNARQFEADKDKPTQSSKDSAEEYLFGKQPQVKKSILKPLVEKTEDVARTNKPYKGYSITKNNDGTWKAEAVAKNGTKHTVVEASKTLLIKSINTFVKRYGEPEQQQEENPQQQASKQTDEMDALKDQMGQAIGELASLLGAKTNLTEEEEAQLIPIMSKIFRIAAKMGYIKFKDAAQHVMSQIRQLAGDEIADKLSIENLQAGYINIAKEIGGNKAEAMQYESIEEIEQEATNAKQEQKTTQLNGSGSTQPGIRQEGEDTSESGQGVRSSGQEKRNIGNVIPKGWEEGPNGMITNPDEKTGGVIDYNISNKLWFFIANNKDVASEYDFKTREDAYNVLKNAIENKKNPELVKTFEKLGKFNLLKEDNSQKDLINLVQERWIDILDDKGYLDGTFPADRVIKYQTGCK